MVVADLYVRLQRKKRQYYSTHLLEEKALLDNNGQCGNNSIFIGAIEQNTINLRRAYAHYWQILLGSVLYATLNFKQSSKKFSTW